MKLFYFLLLSLFITAQTFGQSGNAYSNSKINSKALIMTPIKNTQTGELIGHIPLPKDWKLEGGSITGPNGIETVDYSNNSYTFQQRMFIPLEEVVRQDLEMAINQAGGKILGTFVIPELINYDRAYSELLWSFGNPQKEFYALGVDCEGPGGIKTLLILRQMVTYSQYGNSWGYYINAMDADESVYEEAKSDYIFALSHIQPDMRAIQRYNQNEIAKSNANWAQHSARLAANEAAFNARNQAWMESSNAISDMSMHGWRSRNDMNDKGHSASVDGILDQQKISDPSTGQSITVEAGSKRYFTNGNNEYIRTDDYLYNPNLDNSVNNYEWKEWKGN